MSNPYKMNPAYSGYNGGYDSFPSRDTNREPEKKGMSKGAKIGCAIAAIISIFVLIPIIVFIVLFSVLAVNVNNEIKAGHENDTADPGIVFFGKKEGDIGSAPGQMASYGGLEITASALKLDTESLTDARIACSTITYKNVSDKNKTFNSTDWKLQLPGGEAKNDFFTTNDSPLGAGELVPGASKTGDVCFSNPLQVKGEYVVIHTPDILSEKKLGWVNNNN